MAIDEHGMPVPLYAHGPFKVIPNEHTTHDEAFLILDGEDNVICPIWQKDVGEFFSHAANWIKQCEEIVRRLAEWNDDDSPTRDVVKISIDAANLWAKMQEEAKEGDGETGV